jgi:hypothetical protein
MEKLPRIVVEFEPQDEDVADREFIRELLACRDPKRAAEAIGRHPGTMSRRMGAILIRLLTEEKA